jgi:hypothetical protein
MSEDPETARQIAALAADARPLLVLDVDEVLLEFVRPFSLFLNSREIDLKATSFNLSGNIIDRASGAALSDAEVKALLAAFFDAQHEWQTAAEQAADELAVLAGAVSIVMLTAMPHRHHDRRRAHLASLGFPYPLVTTERAKGPAVALLRGPSRRTVAFVDDIPGNLLSVQATVPDAHLFHLMMHPEFRALLPPLPAGVVAVADWAAAVPQIAAALGV